MVVVEFLQVFWRIFDQSSVVVLVFARLIFLTVVLAIQ